MPEREGGLGIPSPNALAGAAATDALIQALQSSDPYARLTTEATLDEAQRIFFPTNKPIGNMKINDQKLPSAHIWHNNHYPVYMRNALHALREADFQLQRNLISEHDCGSLRATNLIHNFINIKPIEQNLKKTLNTCMKTLSTLEDDRLMMMSPGLYLKIGRFSLDKILETIEINDEYKKDIKTDLAQNFKWLRNKQNNRLTNAQIQSLATVITEALIMLRSQNYIPFSRDDDRETGSTWKIEKHAPLHPTSKTPGFLPLEIWQKHVTPKLNKEDRIRILQADPNNILPLVVNHNGSKSIELHYGTDGSHNPTTNTTGGAVVGPGHASWRFKIEGEHNENSHAETNALVAALLLARDSENPTTIWTDSLSTLKALERLDKLNLEGIDIKKYARKYPHYSVIATIRSLREKLKTKISNGIQQTINLKHVKAHIRGGPTQRQE